MIEDPLINMSSGEIIVWFWFGVMAFGALELLARRLRGPRQ